MNNRNSNNVERPAIKRVAIAGHGFEAWLAANYLLAAFGSKNIEIQVCPVDGSDALDELYAILPDSPDPDLTSSGLSSHVLARACGASFSLGARIDGQAKPYGRIGLDFLGLPFHHHWQRAYPGQGPGGYFAWSLATLAMQRRVFAPPTAGHTGSEPDYGMAHHVNISLFTRLLRERAIRNGVKELKGSLESVKRDDGLSRVVELKSSQGETAQADLYLDCSGPERAVASGTARHKWVTAHGLDDFQLHVSRTDEIVETPCSHLLESTPHGWRLEIPGSGWVSRITLSDLQAAGTELKLTPGHLADPWIENCVAVGTASAVFLPVEPLQFRYFARSIQRVLDLLPGRDCNRSETTEYNRLNRTEAEDLEDLTACYEMARRQGGLNLADRDLSAVSSNLRNRIELFSRRGRVTPGDCDFLEPGDWASSLILLGLIPERFDRMVERLPLDVLMSYLEKMRHKLETRVAEFPPHDIYLNAVKSAR